MGDVCDDKGGEANGADGGDGGGGLAVEMLGAGVHRVSKSRARDRWLAAVSTGILSWCDLGPDPPPLLFSFGPSFRGVSAATGQLATEYAGVQGVPLL